MLEDREGRLLNMGSNDKSPGGAPGTILAVGIHSLTRLIQLQVGMFRGDGAQVGMAMAAAPFSVHKSVYAAVEARLPVPHCHATAQPEESTCRTAGCDCSLTELSW